jgi:hypothetical protein
MNKKLLVKEELLQIFSLKYPDSIKVIEKEVNEFLAARSRLTVKDLDLLEENIKKICWKRKETRPVLENLEKSI